MAVRQEILPTASSLRACSSRTSLELPPLLRRTTTFSVEMVLVLTSPSLTSLSLVAPWPAVATTQPVGVLPESRSSRSEISHLFPNSSVQFCLDILTSQYSSFQEESAYLYSHLIALSLSLSLVRRRDIRFPRENEKSPHMLITVFSLHLH